MPGTSRRGSTAFRIAAFLSQSRPEVPTKEAYRTAVARRVASSARSVSTRAPLYFDPSRPDFLPTGGRYGAQEHRGTDSLDEPERPSSIRPSKRCTWLSSTPSPYMTRSRWSPPEPPIADDGPLWSPREVRSHRPIQQMLESTDGDWGKAAWHAWSELPAEHRVLPGPLFARLFWACSRMLPGPRPQRPKDAEESSPIERLHRMRTEAADIREAFAHLRRLDALAKHGREAGRRLHIAELHALLHAHQLPRYLLRIRSHGEATPVQGQLDSQRIVELLEQHPHFVLDWRLHRDLLIALVWSRGWDDEVVKILQRLTSRGWSRGNRPFHHSLARAIEQSPAVIDKTSAKEEAISIAIRAGPLALPPRGVVAEVFQLWSTEQLLAFRNLETSKASRACAFDSTHYEALRPHAVLELMSREESTPAILKQAEKMLQHRVQSIPLGLPQELDYSVYSHEGQRFARTSLEANGTSTEPGEEGRSVPLAGRKFWGTDFSSLGSDSLHAAEVFVDWDAYVELGYAISFAHAFRALTVQERGGDAVPDLLKAVELFTQLPRLALQRASKALDAILEVLGGLLASAPTASSGAIRVVRSVDVGVSSALFQLVRKLVASNNQLSDIQIHQHERLLQQVIMCGDAFLAGKLWAHLNAKGLEDAMDPDSARSASELLPGAHVEALLAMTLWELPSPKGSYELMPRWHEAAPNIDSALDIFRVHVAKTALPDLLIIRLVRVLLASARTGALALEVLERLQSLSKPLSPALATGLVRAFAEAGDVWADQTLNVAETFSQAFEACSEVDTGPPLNMLAVAIDAASRSFVGWTPTRRSRILRLFDTFRRHLTASIDRLARDGNLTVDELRVDAVQRVLDYEHFHVDKSGLGEALMEHRLRDGALRNAPVALTTLRHAYNGAARAVLAEPAYELGLGGIHLEAVAEEWTSPPLALHASTDRPFHEVPDSIDPAFTTILAELRDGLGVQLDSRAWGLLIVAWLLPYQAPNKARHSRPPSWFDMKLDEADVFGFVRQDFLDRALAIFHAAKDARFERGGPLNLPTSEASSRTPVPTAPPMRLKSGHVGRLIVALARAERFEDAWQVHDDFYTYHAPDSLGAGHTQRSADRPFGWTYGVDGARAFLIARSGQHFTSIPSLLRLPSHRVKPRWRQEIMAARALAKRKGIRFVRGRRTEAPE